MRHCYNLWKLEFDLKNKIEPRHNVKIFQYKKNQRTTKDRLRGRLKKVQWYWLATDPFLAAKWSELASDTDLNIYLAWTNFALTVLVRLPLYLNMLKILFFDNFLFISSKVKNGEEIGR